MSKDKISMPSTQGGLVRYNEGVQSRISVAPEYMIGFIIGVSALILILGIVLL